ncbi:MAG: hypothetical protein IT379_04650 [Deltaproteobacteria bacterium]|nr:hypothetical protein [Deltaproteobacteria bacterium]
MRTSRRYGWLLTLSCFASTALLACSGDDDPSGPATSVAVGTLSDSGGFVSVVSDSSRIVGYVCDGADVAAFFTGPVTDGSFAITTLVGSFSGEVESGAVVGRFAPPTGAEETFSAGVVGSSEVAGIWQAFPGGESGDIVAGWVVDESGAQRGATVNRMSGAVVAHPTLDVAAATTTTELGVATAVRVDSTDSYINAYNFNR